MKQSWLFTIFRLNIVLKTLYWTWDFFKIKILTWNLRIPQIIARTRLHLLINYTSVSCWQIVVENVKMQVSLACWHKRKPFNIARWFTNFVYIGNAILCESYLKQIWWSKEMIIDSIIRWKVFQQDLWGITAYSFKILSLIVDIVSHKLKLN